MEGSFIKMGQVSKPVIALEAAQGCWRAEEGIVALEEAGKTSQK